MALALTGEASRLRAPAVLGYAAGSLGMGVYSTVPGILLLYYMTQVLALPVALASLAVLLPKLVILVAEPTIGAWSDGLRSRWGRRRPFLLAGAVLSAATFVLLFNTPRQADPIATFATVSLAYLAASLAFSLFAVPYVALPAEMSQDGAERARIVGVRMMFVFAGVLVGSAAPPLLVQRLGSGAGGYGRMAAVIAAVSLGCMLVTVMANPKAGAPVRAPASALAALSVLRFPPFATALAIYVLVMTGSSALTAAAPYFVTYVLDAPSKELAPIFTIKVVAALASMAIWTWMTPRLGFCRTWALALVTALAGAATLFSAHAGQRSPDFLAAFAAIGAGAAGVQVAAFALLAEVTARFRTAARHQREGLMTGMWTASEKVALALGPAVTGGLLAITGFVSAAPAGAEPASALEGAKLAISAAPAVIFALSAAALLLTRPVLDTDRAHRSGVLLSASREQGLG